MGTVTIMTLRQDAEDMDPALRAAIEEAFAGNEIQWVRTDPRDHLEHAAQCERLQPAAVILPLEKPVPTTAMEKGVVHLAFTPDGLKRLLKVQPVFADFPPQGE